MKNAIKRAAKALALILCLCLTAGAAPAKADALDMVNLLSPWIEGDEAQLSVSYEIKNLLPYMVSVITMRMALAIPSAIGNEVFVTYIGIGLPVDTPSLGNLIQTGRSLMTVASLRYQLFFPVAVLVVITVSFYIIGNAFADGMALR